MPILLPEPSEPPIVATPAVRQAESRVMAVHNKRGQMVVVTGKAGAGKTTAATYLRKGIDSGHIVGSRGPFRAKYYVSTDLRAVKGDFLQKRVLAEFASRVLRVTSPRDLRYLDVPGTMLSLSVALRMQNIQAVFIDEAGHIPPDGLDQLATLINIVSTEEDHPLTIVLIGMHDLPSNVNVLPQVRRRVAEYVRFGACDPLTAISVLQTVHAYFGSLIQSVDDADLLTDEGQEVMDFLLSENVSDGGLIGLMIPLAERAMAYARQAGLPMGLRALQLAHKIKSSDEDLGRSDMGRNWK